MAFASRSVKKCQNCTVPVTVLGATDGRASGVLGVEPVHPATARAKAARAAAAVVV